MPYITERRQDELVRGRTSDGRPWRPLGAGDLTYLLTYQLQRYLGRAPLRYESIAVCLGALDGCRIDFVDRVVLPYEARKRAENGDVWPAGMLS